MTPTYTIAFVRYQHEPRLGEYFLNHQGLLFKAIEEWLAVVQPEYLKKCTPVHIFIVSDEKIEDGESYISFLSNTARTKKKDEEMYSLDRKIIGKAPDNIIQALIMGRKKEGDTVQFEADYRPVITVDKMWIVKGRRVKQNRVVPYDTPDTYSVKFNEDGTVKCH